jgi:putative transposase
MPRPPRYNLSGVPQHVVQRGNNRQATFFDDEGYRFYKDCLRQAADKHGCAVHAYVLMRNHVHLLITPSHGNGLAKLMQSIGRRYVRYVNDRHGRSGTLWEPRYRAALVEAEPYLLTCTRYIELNPVRAGMVADPADHPWSSYRRHALGEPDRVVTDHPLYRALGRTKAERQAAYRAQFRHGIDAGRLRDIRESVQRCGVLGTERFKDQLEAALSRRVRPGKPGRPRKRRAAETPA